VESIPLLDTVGVVARKVKMCNTFGVLGIAPAKALAEAQPARVQLKTAYRDPVEGGKAGGKSYEKKRPVAPASGDKVATEKRTKTSTEDDRPRMKGSPTGGQATAAKPSKAVVPVKSAGLVIDLATSGSDSDESGDD
jgi:hypothetical protein